MHVPRGGNIPLILPILAELVARDHSIAGNSMRRPPWNKGKIIGPKPPLRQEHVDAISWARVQFTSSRAIFLQEMLNVVRDYGDRFIVGLLLGLEATGVYVFFRPFANASSTLVNSAIVFPARSNLIAAAIQSPTAFAAIYTSILLRALALMAAMLIGVLASLLVFAQLLPEAINDKSQGGRMIFIPSSPATPLPTNIGMTHMDLYQTCRRRLSLSWWQ